MAKHYEEIKELLQKYGLENMVGVGASYEEIEACEKSLGLRFPISYRKFLKEFGWGYFGHLGVIVGLGSDIPKEWVQGVNILNVVQKGREGGLRIPKNIIPFYENGASDWYALACNNSEFEESPVVFIPHEESRVNWGSINKCADSFADWVFNKIG